MSSHSSFPVEVMSEIFRSTELDAEDLANCCLLARRYLESARKWLYSSIELVSTQSPATVGRTHGIGVQLDDQTNRLLNTFNGNPHLGTLVRSIYTQIKCERGCRQAPTWRADSAVDKFYRRTPMVESLKFNITVKPISPNLWFSGALPVLGNDVNSKSRIERLRELEIAELSPDVLTFVTRLVNLRRLRIWRIPEDYEYSTLTVSRLRSFRLRAAHRDFDLRDFLASTAETIEDLQIPLESYFNLSLRDYPQLQRLELFIGDKDEELLWTDGGGTNFWARAEECHNLTTLAFGSYELSSRAIDRLTGYARGLATYSPPSLRRVDFTYKFSLDQLASLVSAGYISELGIVTGYLHEDDNENDYLRMKLIRTMCEEYEVELIHLPWEVACVSSSSCESSDKAC